MNGTSANERGIWTVTNEQIERNKTNSLYH